MWSCIGLKTAPPTRCASLRVTSRRAKIAQWSLLHQVHANASGKQWPSGSHKTPSTHSRPELSRLEGLSDISDLGSLRTENSLKSGGQR